MLRIIIGLALLPFALTAILQIALVAIAIYVAIHGG
jgi:hypothetical protein